MKVRRSGENSGEGWGFGFRRVDCVRVILDGEQSRAQVTGTVHRYPHTVSVPLRVATRLVAAGAPLVIEHGMDGHRNGDSSQ
jgi:hypothetical protein